MQVRPLLSEAVKAVLRPVNESRYVVCIKFSQIAVSPSVGQNLSEFAKAKMFRNLPEFTGIYRNKLYHSVAWSKSFEVPWNNVNVPLVVQNKDNIFTTEGMSEQKYWYFTINSLVRFAHSFVYSVKYQYFLFTYSFSRENIIFIFHQSWHIVTLENAKIFFSLKMNYCNVVNESFWVIWKQCDIVFEWSDEVLLLIKACHSCTYCMKGLMRWCFCHFYFPILGGNISGFVVLGLWLGFCPQNHVIFTSQFWGEISQVS